MSVVHEKLQEASGPVKKYYLKIEGGTTYGPVELPTLSSWAAQGRVLPGNLLSENNHDWIPAEQLVDLKLEWNARFPDGKEYGPFHLLAVPQLVHTGTLPPDSTLFNRITGKTMPVTDIIKADPARPQRPTVVAHKPAQLDLFGEAEKIDEPGAKDDTPEPADAAKQLKRLIREMHDMEAQRSFMQSKAREEEARLRAKIESQEKELQKQAAELAEQKKKAQALERETQTREEKLRAHTAQMSRLPAALAETEKLRKEVETQKTAYNEVRKNAADKEAALTREIQLIKASSATAESSLAALKQELEAQKNQARQRETDLQQKYNQIQKQVETASAESLRQRTELVSQKERYEAMIRHEHDRQDNFKHRIADLEKDLKQKTALLAETTEKLEEERSLQTGTRNTESRKENELRQQMSVLLGKVEESKSEVEDERGKYRKLEQDSNGVIAGLRQRIAELETKEQELTRTVQQTGEELEASRNRIGELQGVNSKSINEIRARLKEATDLAEATRNKLAAQEARNAELKEQGQSLERDLVKQINTLTLRSSEAEQNVQNVHKELIKQKETAVSFEKRSTSLEQELATTRTQNTLLKEQLDAAQKESRILSKTLSKMESEQQKLRVALDSATKAASDARAAAARASAPGQDAAGTPSAVSWGRIAAATAVLAAIAGIGYYASTCSFCASQARPVHVAATTTTTQPPQKPVKIAADSAPKSVPLPATNTVTAKKPLWPHIAVPGTRAVYSGEICTITFDTGLFTSMTNTIPDATNMLGAIALQLREHGSNLVIEIEGHCDSTPVSSKAAVGDNIALGKSRADHIAGILRDQFNVPAASIRTTSLGDKDPPFPGEDDLTRRKNRTVVLKLLQK